MAIIALKRVVFGVSGVYQKDSKLIRSMFVFVVNKNFLLLEILGFNYLTFNRQK